MGRHLLSGFQLPSVVRFYLSRLQERLWLKPLLSCILSIAAVLIAGIADGLELAQRFPEISPKSLETVLSIMSASMLVIAMFAVGAMLSAYASVSSTATPRAFPLVVSDDVSQNALSTFIGAFIFSIVGLVAHLNGFYESAGRFVLFLITLCVFAVVVLVFVRWVDRIARLGRLTHTVDKVETATAAALKYWAHSPRMGASCLAASGHGHEICTESIGYVQNIDLAKLQNLSEQYDCIIGVCAPPGTFVTPSNALVRVVKDSGSGKCPRVDEIVAAFVIGGERTFESDPRFGLIVMSEIASRALSPAVNDPGTAIDIIGSLVRLLVQWSSECKDNSSAHVKFDRVEMPDLDVKDVFEDAFGALARDGAAAVEVGIRLQKAYLVLSGLGDTAMTDTSVEHSMLALRYAEKSLMLEEEVNRVRVFASQVADTGK